MELTPLQILSGAVGSAAGGGGVSSFFAWLGGRRKTEAQAQAYAQGAVDHAVKTALAGMELAVGTLQAEVTRLVAAVADGDRKHKDCELRLGEVNAAVAALKHEREQQKAEIDRLMAGDVPGYGPRIPK